MQSFCRTFYCGGHVTEVTINCNMCVHVQLPSAACLCNRLHAYVTDFMCETLYTSNLSQLNSSRNQFF